MDLSAVAVRHTLSHLMATSMLCRLIDGGSGIWSEPATRAADALNAIRKAEERRIATGLLPAVGLVASAHRQTENVPG